MAYRYRWIYCIVLFALFLLSGYVFDLRDLREQYRLLEDAKYNLQYRMQHVNSVSKTTPAVTVSTDGLAELLNQKFVRIDEVKRFAENTNGILFSGDFSQIYHFLHFLLQNAKTYQISHFLLKMTENQQLQGEMNIQIKNAALFQPPDDSVIKVPPDPFCSANAPVSPAKMPRHLFPIKSMRVAGFLRQNKQSRAIIIWPDGSIEQASAGSKIGKEHAVVKSVTDHLTILLNRRTIRIFKSFQ